MASDSFRSFDQLSKLDRTLYLVHGLLMLLAGLMFLPLLSAQEQQPTGREMVDALHSAFGEHHERAVHAKGTIVTGTFLASAEASHYTKALHLQPGGSIRVIARFSDFTGIPDIPDSDPNSNPKGFAIRFLLPDGQVTDVVTHSFNGFPVATAGEFRTLLQAIGKASAKPGDASDLTKFLGAHPIAKTFLSTQKPSPESWATTPYFGVNAFRFENRQGRSWYIRYRFVPLAGEKYLSPEEVKTASPNYLSVELRKRLQAAPIRFRMQAQLAASTDDYRDPSIAWPNDRTFVDLGTVTLTDLVDEEEASRNLQFEPASVIPGIAVADPMLQVRRTAYPVSVSERQ